MTKRARPHAHMRRLKSGKKVHVNKGVKKKTQRKSTIRIDVRSPFSPAKAGEIKALTEQRGKEKFDKKPSHFIEFSDASGQFIRQPITIGSEFAKTQVKDLLKAAKDDEENQGIQNVKDQKAIKKDSVLRLFDLPDVAEQQRFLMGDFDVLKQVQMVDPRDDRRHKLALIRHHVPLDNAGKPMTGEKEAPLSYEIRQKGGNVLWRKEYKKGKDLKPLDISEALKTIKIPKHEPRPPAPGEEDDIPTMKGGKIIKKRRKKRR